jgi:segregation and condensation protein A
METYIVKIDAFEGPFDLLFHLIEKNKIDIYDIPISLITDQYLDYIDRMHVMDLDTASEFLVMASTLLHIKSRLLLPAPAPGDLEEDVKDPRDELVISMIEYKKYKEFTKSLRENQAYWGDAYYRPAGDGEPDENVKAHIGADQLSLFDMDKNKFLTVYRNLIETNRRKRENVDGKINKIIEREHITLTLKIKEILNFLIEKPRFLFQKLYNPAHISKRNIITAFIALLELTHQNLLTLRQKKLYGALLVSRKEKNTT